jgi:hypothetical protein
VLVMVGYKKWVFVRYTVYVDKTQDKAWSRKSSIARESLWDVIEKIDVCHT